MDNSGNKLTATDRKLIYNVIDAHCHLTDDTRFFSYVANKSVNVKGLCLCSASPADWPLVQKAITEFSAPDMYACFGVHPWKCQSVSSEDTSWTSTLTEYLVNHPQSLVGEIGLDKASAAETFKTGHQQKIFELQFNIASALRRPVNSHCVRAHGWLLDFLRKYAEDDTKFFPRVLCHSWTGSPEMVTGLLKLPKNTGKKIWFGFSGAINLTNSSKKLEASVLAVPENRIVIESDHDTCTSQDDSVLAIIIYISNVKGWDFAKTVKITSENFLNFVNGTD